MAHKRAIEATGPENQLISLWFAFEAMMLPRGEATGGFEGYLRAAKPAIMLGYIRRRVLFIFEALKSSYPEEFGLLLKECQQENLFEAFISIISGTEREGAFQRLIELCVDDPLLAHRITELRGNIGKKSVIRHMLESHWSRVEWQIRRVYRARNVLAHEADTYPCDIGSLCVHFHDYYDTVLDELVYYWEVSKTLRSLSNYYKHITADYTVYRETFDAMEESLPQSDLFKIINTNREK